MLARTYWIAMLMLGLLGPAARSTTLKLATLVPAGSTWDRALNDMASSWEEETEGRVKVRFYPGGVAGDDPDVVRKMRIGQLQAGTLTVTGLAEIHESFRVFTIPMLFRDYDELFAVLDRVGPDLAAALREKGFELVHWVPGGWVRFFSKRPVTRVSDLQAQKLFTWAGDEGMVNAWERNGFHPVALAYTDMPVGLETGLIEALPATPLAALSLQWFRRAPHMLDVGVAPLIGATVVRRSAWEKIAPADREIMTRVAKRAEDSMRGTVPRQDASALEEMQIRGLSVSVAESQADWQNLANDFALDMKGSLVPTDIYDEVQRILEELRRDSSR
jgi:TRAP-type C4-dicarboxylate transport system substrate-binding protein